MAERFDVLVLGISEKDALSLLFAKTADVPRPSDRYFAATRLGLCGCDKTFDALIRALMTSRPMSFLTGSHGVRQLKLSGVGKT